MDWNRFAQIAIWVVVVLCVVWIVWALLTQAGGL